MNIPTLEIERRNGCWWITGIAVGADEDDADGVGPYTRKVDADDDRRGLVRFYREELAD